MCIAVDVFSNLFSMHRNFKLSHLGADSQVYSENSHHMESGKCDPNAHNTIKTVQSNQKCLDS